jgi:guanylate kinase
VGKGTVVERLLELRPELVLSISCTTRAPRPGELDGREYHFVSPHRFEELVQEGAFLEWAELYGRHKSGTLAAPVRDAVEQGRDMILEIDVQGAGWVHRRMPDAVLIFLRPPSMDALAKRLAARQTEDAASIARRLARANEEMADASWFDHVVVNDEVDRAAREVAAIIEATGRGSRGSDPMDATPAGRPRAEGIEPT